MNGGGYGGSFDLDPFANGYYDHHQSAQGSTNSATAQQRYQLQAPVAMHHPCYGDRYDPQQTAAAGIDPLAYNSTSTGATHPLTHTHSHTHTMLQPPPRTAAAMQLPASLEPDPIANSVEMRHQTCYNPITGAMDLIGNDSSYNSLFQDTLDDLASSIVNPLPQSAPSSIQSRRQSHLRPRSKKKQHQYKNSDADTWLEAMSMDVSGISLEPMTGAEVYKTVQSATDDVVTRYLPCVEFLVACQQELRQGLSTATQKRVVRGTYRDSMTPRQFYNRYIQTLPDRFFRKHQHLMDPTHLQTAILEIQKLCDDSRKVEYQGCEAMKNAYLGGMKEGVSWGLRKWLSKNGGALTTCNNLECVLNACQKLDRGAENTKKLSEKLCPLGKQAFDRLKGDVPTSYQEQSTAHPYLPFFHRLECALRGISNFDPEDDDVICIDDEDEIEEVKAISVTLKDSGDDGNKRKGRKIDESPVKRMKPEKGISKSIPAMTANGNYSEVNRDLEVADLNPVAERGMYTTGALNAPKIELRCTRCTMLNPAGSPRCCMCDYTFDNSENYQIQELSEGSENFNIADVTFEESTEPATSLHTEESGIWTPPRNGAASTETSLVRLPPADTQMTAGGMIERLETLAFMFDSNKQHHVRPPQIDSAFWNERYQYASALRLFGEILQNRGSKKFLEPIDEERLMIAGGPPYCGVVRNPLCFFDIVQALHGNGELAIKNLACWNMWRGIDLLEAIDLVFLNSLAYNGKERTKERSNTNALRKILWQGIDTTVSEMYSQLDDKKRRDCTPTRRGELSGFVILKK